MGRYGGLALMWKREVNLEIKCFSNSVIHSCVKSLDKETPDWFVTGVYGSPTTEARQGLG